jgi:predicted nucleic acid-binding protein
MTDLDTYSTVLVDTNVISFLFKKDSRGNLYKPHLKSKLGAVAAQTYAELEVLPLQNNWSLKRHNELRNYLSEKFTFIEISKDISLKWAQIRVEMRRLGKPIDTADAWIAATALVFSVPLVTHNYKDFKNIAGLKIISENN